MVVLPHQCPGSEKYFLKYIVESPGLKIMLHFIHGRSMTNIPILKFFMSWNNSVWHSVFTNLKTVDFPEPYKFCLNYSH